MAFWLTSLLVLFLSVTPNSAQHDYFTSITGLERLLAAEENLLTRMEQYLHESEQTLWDINNFVDIIANHLENVDKKTYENPLSALKAFKRFAIDWHDAESALLANEATDALNETYATSLEQLPAPVTDEDVSGAVEAISRLQFTYNLKTQDLADGMLYEQQESTPMSADDCFTMATYLLKLGKLETAVEWLFITKSKLEQQLTADNETAIFPHVSEISILRPLVYTLIYTGNLKLADELNSKLYHLGAHELAHAHKRLIKEEMVKNRQFPIDTVSWRKAAEEPLFKQVCSGELRPTARQQRNLRCRYVCHKKPQCLISPFKLEELSLDPFVGYFYDVIYDEEINIIRNASEENLERSTVGADFERSKIRTSKNAWINYENLPELGPFVNRMTELTGLNLTYREELQVANYGIGGHYAPHVDPLVETEDYVFADMGNRILTALFYINDVDAGGATAFPFLKIAVPAKKGSAVVWYNLHKDLNVDYRTWHTGCPVMSGSKWIVTQWFHSFGQEFLRPCGLKPDHKVSLSFEQKMDDQYKLRFY